MNFSSFWQFWITFCPYLQIFHNRFLDSPKVYIFVPFIPLCKEAVFYEISWCYTLLWLLWETYVNILEIWRSNVSLDRFTILFKNFAFWNAKYHNYVIYVNNNRNCSHIYGKLILLRKFDLCFDCFYIFEFF